MQNEPGTALTAGQGCCERIVVTAKSGKTYNLGKPDSILFPLRIAWYKWKRRKELAHG